MALRLLRTQVPRHPVQVQRELAEGAKRSVPVPQAYGEQYLLEPCVGRPHLDGVPRPHAVGPSKSNCSGHELVAFAYVLRTVAGRSGVLPRRALLRGPQAPSLAATI